MSALSGIRVLDLAGEPGVYCGRLLADLGAEVIKIEPPGGDPTRDIGPFIEDRPDRGRSLFFWHYNTGKRSVVLDLTAPEDRDRFDRLLHTADAAVTTGTPGALRAQRLDGAALLGRNPRLVLAAIGPFGQSGPRREWKSCDTVAQAAGGMLFLNGHPGEPPLRSLGLQAYHCAAAQTAIGIVLALLARRRTGRGQLIDISLQECVAATVEHATGIFRETGRVAVRRGTLHWTGAFRAGKCRDGYVLHSSLGDWTSLIEWVKADGKAADLSGAEWEDFEYRRDHCEHLFDVLDAWGRDRVAADLAEGAQLRRLPYAPIRPLAALARDEQLRARGFFTRVEHDNLGRALLYPGTPPALGPGRRPRRRAPRLGEHTGEIFAELDRASTVLTDHPGIGGASPQPAGALQGIRVLDFTHQIAGPAATRILADHGAEVIVIERPGSVSQGSRRGGVTGNLNRGKKSVVIRMTDRRGVALARELIRHCDIVIDNFSSRVMPNWGLDYPTLRRIKPDIIVVRMTGFGCGGPRENDVSYGPTLHALAGYTHAMRHPGGEPAGWGFSFSDTAAGYGAALAALAALRQREQTGNGQLIDVSQFELLVALIGPALLDTLVHGAERAPHGNGSQERPAAPHGVYRCRDLPGENSGRERWCAICVFTDEEWRRLAGAMGHSDSTRDLRFATLSERLARRRELDELVGKWTRRRSAESVAEMLQRAGVAAAVVADAEDLCVRDTHLQARGYWVEVACPEGENVVLDGIPVRLSATPGRVEAPGPLPGEHTDQVLREVLELEQTAVDELRADGIVA